MTSRDKIIPESKDGEVWKLFKNHWVSNLGELRNCFGKTKELSSEGKYYLDKTTKIYIGRLLAEVFEIEDYKKLSDSKYCVTRIDDSKKFTVDNIKVVSRAEVFTNIVSGGYLRPERVVNHNNSVTNKKTRAVIQFALDDKSTPIAEFPSVAKASKDSGEPEHRIREICNNKKNASAKFYWEWKNKEESEAFSKKYSSSTK